MPFDICLVFVAINVASRASEGAIFFNNVFFKVCCISCLSGDSSQLTSVPHNCGCFIYVVQPQKFIATARQIDTFHELSLCSWHNADTSRWRAPNQCIDAHKHLRDRGMHGVLCSSPHRSRHTMLSLQNAMSCIKPRLRWQTVATKQICLNFP